MGDGEFPGEKAGSILMDERMSMAAPGSMPRGGPAGMAPTDGRPRPASMP